MIMASIEKWDRAIAANNRASWIMRVGSPVAHINADNKEESQKSGLIEVLSPEIVR